MNDPSVEPWLAEGAALVRAGRLDQAAQVYRHVLTLDPHHATRHACLGELALRAGQTAAEEHLTAALASDPTLLTTANNLAILYRQTGRPEQARDLLQATVARAPEFPEAHFNLGNALLSLEDYDAATTAYETALRLRPRYAKALTNLARCYRMMLRLDRCLECLEQARELDPSPLAHSNWLFTAMFSPEVSAETIAAQAAAWDERFAGGLPPLPSLTPPARKDLDRPLRVGFVSPNFSNHTIGRLMEPLLAGLDRTQFVPYCYSDTAAPDPVTARCRALAAVFRETIHLTDEQLTQLIRQDGIDILIDTNLHMTGSRLRALARRAAPVQINHLAYPFTCGLQTMDYRVTDAVLDPPGLTPLGPEAVIRLRASFWLYRPDAGAPEPALRLPARKAGHVTFANFNYTQKLNPGVAAVWARILQRVPGARLVQLAAHPATQRSHIIRLYAEAGLDTSRLVLVGTEPHHLHLGRLRQADLCLDPFPYGGHTTTLDALWMEVPTLTLAGAAPYTRAAASILSRAGLDELVTSTLEVYEESAVALAHDLERLEALRHNLRARMRASLLCDEKSYLADYEQVLRRAWRRFCQGQPPSAMDLSGQR